jgi:1-deoxy-D-xylulose-5-phosphate reductoisomerase
MNAANESAVSAFLSERIGFMQMPDVVEYALDKNQYVSSPDLGSLESSDRAARETAEKFIKKISDKK